MIEKYPKKAGIYKLTCVENGKMYIGKSVNICARLNAHKNSINRNNNYHFQNAIKKYGWENFIIEILEIFENFDKINDNTKLLEREAYYIEKFNSNDNSTGYNICTFSNDCTGIPKKKMSEETKEKLRKLHIGRKVSDEAKLKMSQSKKGKTGFKHSEETKEKIRRSKLGKRKTPEHIEKIRIAMTGKKQSESVKLKSSLSRKGKPGKPCSEETKEKLRQINLGKRGFKHSEESIKLMRQSKLGKKHSEETKMKISNTKLGKKNNKIKNDVE
jgi:group I intron endonuclease